ncbi:Aldehyde/histidinol dehydrogenase [Mariannaea sp. PMI_226]|nr:Aldehyde/histidinol dehydrogenase [Mariannaea sp. PMI_226]
MELPACVESVWRQASDYATTNLNVSQQTFSIAASAIAVLFSLFIARRVASLVHATLFDKVQTYQVPQLEVPEPKTFVDTPSVQIAGSTAINCYAPATGEFLKLANPLTPDGIDRAIDAADTAQRQWKQTTFAQRKAVLRSLLQYILDNAEEICRVACIDSGKTLVDAQLGEILVTVEKIQWTLKHGEKALRPSRRPTNFLMSYKRNTVHYEPLGVVAALVSWNYPFHNMMGPIISALFAGNGIVVKVSEQCVWSSHYFSNIIRGALVVHGFDPKLVQVIACWPSTADHLTSHPNISHITFIGSHKVAKLVTTSAAKSLTPVLAELGGKDPFIVLDSAAKDLDRIVEIILRGTFQAAGQNCIGIERVIASPAIYDKLVERLEPRVKALRIDQLGDVGAMISDISFSRLEGMIAEAVEEGAQLRVGGKRYTHPTYPKGHYFQPTLLTDVVPDMKIAHRECFAPVLTVMRAKSSSAADILAIANDTAYDLGASVFGSESDPQLQRIVRNVRAGMVAVNDFAAYYAVQLPFGGVDGSGYGRFAGEEGLRGMCNLKAVCEDRFGWAGIRTAIPPPVQYPIANQEKSWAFTQGVVELGYGDTVRKAEGLYAMFKHRNA